MLELEGVSKRVGDQMHLTDILMRLEPGSLNVLLGPTLSGKTSLMRLMAGLDRPTAGRVIVDGADVTGVPVQKRDVAMVYQQFINYPALTVYENIASPMRIAKRSKADIEAMVAKTAALLKLEPYLDRTPLQLSGGQQQRTAIARALAKEAKLVLLDEPLANLDYKLREELRTELPKIFSASGAIFVYATAEPEEALLLGGRTATLSEGRVTQFGPTTSVYREPRTLLTARTFSDPPLNVLRMEKSGAVFGNEDGGRVPVPDRYRDLADGRYHIAVRPHHLWPRRRAADAITLPVTVGSSEITGSETYAHVDCFGAPFVMLTHGVHTFEPGSAMEVHFEPRHLMVFDADGTAITGEPQKVAA